MAQRIAQTAMIIGGGIGGLTTAQALLQTGNFRSVKVFERAKEFFPHAGAGFTLQPNGQAVLTSLGFSRADLQGLVNPYHAWCMLGSRGELINRKELIQQISARVGYPLGGCLRAELIDALAKPLGSHLHYSHEVDQISVLKDRVEVSFTDPSIPNESADILIGADGIHSKTIQTLFPNRTAPIFSDENLFYGVIDTLKDDAHKMNQFGAYELHKDPNALVQSFTKGEFIHYRAGGEGRYLIWAATYKSKAPPAANQDREWTQGRDQKELGELLEKWPREHPIHKFAENTSAHRLMHFGLFYRQCEPDWVRDRVVLLGDSAHATLPYVGMGANMAIEDAFVLAECLKKHGFAFDAAFQEYNLKRFPRTKQLVHMARKLGLFLHSESWLAGPLRRFLLPHAMGSRFFIDRVVKEFYDHSPIPLKSK